jgi:uncharacterized phage protein (TIGR01671 family)
MNTDRFRFRVWDPEDKLYTSFPWFAEIHNSRLEVEAPKELEQCTGLKDKNGNLIFEGDIVKCDLDNQRKNLISQVVWCNGCFCMNRCGIVQKEVYEYYNIEIIGNIHDEQFC